jgi:hypothetical protein
MNDQPSLFDGRPGKASGRAPQTSWRAARNPKNRMNFGTQRWEVAAVLLDCGPSTCAEVAVHVGLSRNQTATRLMELREDGFVAYLYDDAGVRVTRPTGPRDEGLVQTITMSGVHALTEAAEWHNEHPDTL